MEHVYWVQANFRNIPPNAVHGGVDIDGKQIYIGRASHHGDLLPAKVIPEKRAAYVCHGGKEHHKDSFQILCERRHDWIASANGQVPKGAVEGGRTSDGERLYIGRVFHNNARTVGKIQPSHKCLYIPFDGKEVSFTSYEVLVTIPS